MIQHQQMQAFRETQLHSWCLPVALLLGRRHLLGFIFCFWECHH